MKAKSINAKDAKENGKDAMDSGMKFLRPCCFFAFIAFCF